MLVIGGQKWENSNSTHTINVRTPVYMYMYHSSTAPNEYPSKKLLTEKVAHPKIRHHLRNNQPIRVREHDFTLRRVFFLANCATLGFDWTNCSCSNFQTNFLWNSTAEQSGQSRPTRTQLQQDLQENLGQNLNNARTIQHTSTGYSSDVGY